MAASNSDRLNLSAWAYELLPGDVVGEREVESVDDPDGPDVEFHRVGPGTVTVNYTDGDPEEMDRMASVSFTRTRESAAAWMKRNFPVDAD